MSEPTIDPPNPSHNTGHGHVFPRPDGVVARCGGPGLCRECNRDAQRRKQIGRRVIGIQGKKGSGKSVIASYLLERGFQRIKFATVLKDMLRVLLRRRGASAELIERMIEGDLKEVATPLLNGKSPRCAMQSLGTWGRGDIHPDLWVDIEMDALPVTGDFTCDDVRFPNEAAAIKRVGGMLIRVERPGLAVSDQHESESHTATLPTDFIVTNDGTIEQLQDKITLMLMSGKAMGKAA